MTDEQTETPERGSVIPPGPAPAPEQPPAHHELKDLAARARALYADELHDRLHELVKRL